MIIKEEIQIVPLSGHQKRRLYIYLPEDYDRSSCCYSVMYMFDGHNVFFDEDATYGKCWGMKTYMDQEKLPLIIVAVECNHEGHGRLEEYAPWNFRESNVGSIQGKGKAYMDWLTKTLKPEIDAKLRTKPEREFTFICGSSMGGLMSVYGITEYNHIFSKAAALSPSLWCGTGKITQLIKTTDFDENTQIYMDYGSRELDGHEKLKYALKRVTGAFLDKNVYVCTRIIPGGTHCEASWEQQIPVFMRCLGLDQRGENI